MKHSIGNVLLMACLATNEQAAMPIKSSILQDFIEPYLVSQDCGDQLQSTNEQLATAELLLSDTAIPDASDLDTTIAALFSLSPCTINCAGYNPSDPLLEQINNGLIPYLQNALTNIGEISEIVQIAAGDAHTVVLTANGKVYATGDNTFGQLGTGNNTSSDTLVPMIGEGSSGVTAIATGKNHTLILKGDVAYGTGDNTSGQLGIGTNVNVNTLTPMVGQGSSGVTAISGGFLHSVVLKSGAVYATGLNTQGQLGTGDNVNSNILVAMNGQGTSGITAIAAGYLHTVVIEAGAAYATGWNVFGQLGIGSNADANTLTIMNSPGDSGVTAIAAGDFHSIVVKSGTGYGTGANFGGELGTGNNLNSNVLVAMNGQGTSGITAITANGESTLALKNNQLYATGLNTNGQLGIGNNSSVNTLTATVGQEVTAVTDISCGTTHAIILKTGATYATGKNTAGQLGIGNTSDTNTFTEIASQVKIINNINEKTFYILN